MISFIRRLFADIIGLVFFFSAITKLMDPVGTGLIVDSYLDNMSLDFLRPLSKWLGELLALAEAAVSIGLLTGAFRKFFAWLATAMTVFFTGISIWLAIANPDMDCGCFGEAIPLTHMQTLIKNVFLCVCCIPAFVPYSKLGKPRVHRYVAFWIGMGVMVLFAVVSLLQQPIVEFSEFAPSHTIVTDNSTEDTWEYPTLPVWDGNGNDVSDVVLDGNVAVISFYHPEKADRNDIIRAASFAQDAFNAGYNAIVLSCGEIDVPGVGCYQADYKKLITLNRDNGGVTLLYDGYIVRKRNSNHYFSYEQLQEMISTDAVESYIESATRHTLTLQGFILIFLAILILV